MWLRSYKFDLVFILGVLGVSVAAAWASQSAPKYFPLILFIDLWLLGYHHVVSTFTRLSFDLESFRNNRFLLLGLPWIIVAGAMALTFILGPWALASVYLYWQWFHYTRQNYGIVRAYARKASAGEDKGTNFVEQLIVYAVPLYGILSRSAENPTQLLGMPLKVLPVGKPILEVMGPLVMSIVLAWVALQVRDCVNKRFRPLYALYIVAHLTVFWFGYVGIKNIDHGWLCINIWHNAQYIMFVWLTNNNQFKAGIEPKKRFISMLSQQQNMFWYFAVCLGLSTLIYVSIDRVSALLSLTAVPLVVIVYQTLNFHHYVVDGIIWKRRKTNLKS